MEAAYKDTKSFKTTDQIAKKIGSHPHNIAGRNCYCCGYSNHILANCKFKDAKCLKCRKTGHIAIAPSARLQNENNPMLLYDSIPTVPKC